MSDDPELKPLRQQAKERNEYQERMREREEQRYNSNGANRRMDQKKDDKQNNLYMMKDSFKGELYNEEDFDHFSYFNSLREKQLAIERQDTSDLLAFKTVVTIEEKNKPEVNLSKQTEAATAIKLSRKVLVKPKQLIEAAQAKTNMEQHHNIADSKQETLSGKRERTLSQEQDLTQEKGNQLEKKLKKDEETQEIVPSGESDTTRAQNEEVQSKKEQSIKQSSNSKNIHTIDNKSKNSSTKEQPNNGKLAAVLGYSSSSSDSE